MDDNIPLSEGGRVTRKMEYRYGETFFQVEYKVNTHGEYELWSVTSEGELVDLLNPNVIEWMEQGVREHIRANPRL